VTDVGLQYFEGKTFALHTLNLTGLIGVTGHGLYQPIFSCKETLRIYCGALMDQEEMKVAEFGKALGNCFKLQSFDLSGNKHMTDEFFSNLTSQAVGPEGKQEKPGLAELHTAKMAFLVNISDVSVQKVCQTSKVLEHLEINGCEKITEFGLDNIFKNFHSLQFVDLNLIPVITPALLEQLKAHRPDILFRRYKLADIDPKDNMLRVPWRIAEKGGAKGKKKKKKK